MIEVHQRDNCHPDTAVLGFKSLSGALEYVQQLKKTKNLMERYWFVDTSQKESREVPHPTRRGKTVFVHGVG